MADDIATSNTNHIPTGEFTPVKATIFDFTELTPIGKNIESPTPHMMMAQFQQCARL